MTIDKKTYLITGSDEGTREKIRLKLRMLLNKHKSPRLILTDYQDQKLEFELSKIGYKSGAIVYSSSKYEACYSYWENFYELYFNEWSEQEKPQLLWLRSEDKKKGRKVPFQILVAFKSSKKTF